MKQPLRADVPLSLSRQIDHCSGVWLRGHHLMSPTQSRLFEAHFEAFFEVR